MRLRFAAVILCASCCAAAQDFGTHTLPPDLADPAAKVLGVLNKDPGAAGRALGYCEGPATDADGDLFFTEENAGKGNIWKVAADGKASLFYNGPALPNGMEFDPQGRLIACEQGGLTGFDKAGARTPLAMTGPAAADLKRLNDVTIARDGGMWFTNHSTGNTYFYRDPAGQVVSYPNDGPLGVLVPNGIEFIEERNLLLVNSSGDNKVYQFDVGADRKPSGKRLFAGVAVPDGLTADERGNIYVASYADGAIYVFGPAGGSPLGKITLNGNASPEANASNCVFGGPEGKTLFMTGDGGAYKLQLKVAGRKRPGATGLVRSRSPARMADPAGRGGISAGIRYSPQGRRLQARRPAEMLYFRP